MQSVSAQCIDHHFKIMSRRRKMMTEWKIKNGNFMICTVLFIIKDSLYEKLKIWVFLVFWS